MSKLILSLKVKDFGAMKSELYPEVAPNTVSNFVKYVESGFYTDKIFHRIIRGFMIQGGRSFAKIEPIKGECTANGHKSDLKHTRGVISIARTNHTNPATSQFVIMHKASPHLDGQYAAFGKVIEGLEIVDKIATTQTNHMDMPLTPVVIENFTILENTFNLKPVEYV